MKKIILLFNFVIIYAMLVNAQNWAGLKIFKEENAQLGPPKKNENRVVFMGNSIFHDWSKYTPEFFAGKSYVNRGISGQTTAQMLVRFRQDVIDLKPTTVVILAGTNDIAGNTGPTTNEMIMDNLISMAELSKCNNIKVIMCAVLPVFKYKWAPDVQPVERIKNLDSLIKNYATKNKFGYVDFYTPMVNEVGGMKDEYSLDGVHPNPKGYQVMGPLVERTIKKVQ